MISKIHKMYSDYKNPHYVSTCNSILRVPFSFKIFSFKKSVSSPNVRVSGQLPTIYHFSIHLSSGPSPISTDRPSSTDW